MKFVDSKYFGFSVLIFFVFFLVWSFGPMKAIEQKLVNATGSKEMLDLKPSSSSLEIYDYVTKIGEPGREVLAEMYTFQDLIYPLAYGLFFAFGILYFISRSFPERKKMLWLSLPAFLMMIADYLENFSILIIISNPTEKMALANYVGLFTTTKWILGLISIVFFLVFGLTFIAKKISRKKKN